MEPSDPASYGDAFADVYDEWYAGISDVDGAVEMVARLAHELKGPVLEMGPGTGRIALPLATRGLEVHGIEASMEMVERMRAKPGGGAIALTIGDFSRSVASTGGPFSVVLLAFNTLFNLPDASAQQRCFALAARQVMEGGWVVVEAMVPDDDPDSPDAVVVPTRIEAGEVVMQCTIRDRSAQTVSGSVIAVSQAGVRLRPWSIRYATPEQLDAMAAGAGLEMAKRWSDWHEGSFTGESTLAITLYHRVRAPAGKIQNVALPVAVDR